MADAPRPRVFAKIATLRAWFAKNHATKTELWMKYHKVGTDRTCVRYPEALDEALCWGWIDGTVRSIDDESYMQRWTPRRRDSNWSAVNLAKVEKLLAEGRMQPAGLAAFETRDPARSGVYGHEGAPPQLPAPMAKALRADAAAWAWWQHQPPSYQRNATGYIIAAKKPETRERRFAQLLACSRRGERLAHLTAPRREGAKGGRET